MRPLKIVVKGFLPFYGAVTLDLSQIHGAVVTGFNGVGKTSLVVASILFVLYGYARKRPEGLIHDLADGMNVTLTFDHQGQVYVVERGMQRGKSPRLSLKVLSPEERDLTERLTSSTQETLANIIGVSYDLLLASSIAQQEETQRLFDLTPS